MTNALLEKEHHSVPVSAGEDDMRQYLHEIRQFPRLTPEEERLLAKACAEGDEKAIRQMVNSNLRLVVSVAREYAGRGVPLMVLSARSALLQELEQEPTHEQIGCRCGMETEKVTKLMQMIPELCSLDTPAGEDEETTLGNLLEDLNSLQPQEELVRKELKRIMDDLLGQLTERQQQVLRLHYGMDTGKCLSLEEIGKALGISKERARQIEHQAMDKLRKMGTDLGLEDFLE